METIAILTTTKNGANTIKKALNSACNQTIFKKNDFNYKLVVVNDRNSTDNLSDIIKEYPNLIYSEAECGGLVCGRNKTIFTAMQIPNCRFFCILDSDDEWHLNKLENQIPFMIKNEIDVCGAGLIFNMTNGSKEVFYPETHEEIFQSYMNGNNPIAHPSVVFNKKILNKCGGYDDSCTSEDYDLFSRAVKYYKFHNVQKCLVNYTYDYDKRDPQYPIKIQEGAKKIFLKFLVNNDKILN